jgi:hypothetical protein
MILSQYFGATENSNMLEALIHPVTTLLDKFIENKDQKNLLAHRIATMAESHAQELAKAQLEVNKVEAAHRNMFVSGWRPAVGWTCALALAESEVSIPLIALSEMMPVLLGMLGLGTMRTIEKTKSVARNS